MPKSELITRFFPDLTDLQKERFASLEALYADWNSKINVISRKDFDSLYLHHVLHSLAIARVCSFDEGARILDIGCGGGFPSIPLAIMFPQAKFTAVDSIAKKIKVVQGVASSLGLDNIEAVNMRVEQLPGRFDYAVSRAVAETRMLVGWVWNKIERGCRGTLPNGMICLKGGELAEELALTGKRWTIFEISQMFDEDYFSTKKVIYSKKA